MTKSHDKQVKHWSGRNSLMDKYWNDELLIRGSKKLAKKISQFDPKSIFEVGTYNGRNLYYAHEHMPYVKLGGLDVNEEALKFARANLPESTQLTHCDALYMDTEEKYDIVFTHGVLMHIDPKTIGGVIDNCIAKANKYIIHVERLELNNKIIKGPKEYKSRKVSNQLRWCPDIISLYKQRKQRIVANKQQNICSQRRQSSVIIIAVVK